MQWIAEWKCIVKFEQRRRWMNLRELFYQCVLLHILGMNLEFEGVLWQLKLIVGVEMR